MSDALPSVPGLVVSVERRPEWERRVLETIRQLRERGKDAILIFDARTHAIRVYDGRALESVKLD